MLAAYPYWTLQPGWFVGQKCAIPDQIDEVKYLEEVLALNFWRVSNGANITIILFILKSAILFGEKGVVHLSTSKIKKWKVCS